MILSRSKTKDLLRKTIGFCACVSPIFLTGCSLTVPLIVFSGNGEEVLKGTATGYLDGHGTIKFAGTKLDVKCTGGFQYQRRGYAGWGTGKVSCTDGTKANFKFDAATSSKGYGSGEDNKGRFFFFAYGYKESVARMMFETAAGDKLPKLGPKLIPPTVTLSRYPAIKETKKTQDLVARVNPQTVRIKSGESIGSGFFIGGEKLILTNSHVVGLRETVQIVYSDNTMTTGKVIGRSGDIDVALIDVYQPNTLPTPVAFCYGGKPEVGESVIAIGNPVGLGTTVTKGIVSGLRGAGIGQQIQTDTPVNPGNSGGPLINNKGEVIGIVTSKLGGIGIDNIAFAIPTEQAIDSMGFEVQDQSESGKLTYCGNRIKGSNFFGVISSNKFVSIALSVIFVLGGLLFRFRNRFSLFK